MKRILSLIVLVALSTTAQAHFPWLTVGEDGKATYFFGENPADCTYKLPPGIAKATIQLRSDGKPVDVETETIESDDFVGKKSAGTVPTGASLTSQATFGVYHGAKLQYYTQHLGGKLPSKLSDCKAMDNVDFQIHAVDTDSGVDVHVLWKGKPLADAEVRLYCQEGHEEGSAKTDANGKVSFNDKQVEDGTNGIMVGHTITGSQGTLGDQAYTSEMHYLTATFQDPEDH